MTFRVARADVVSLVLDWAAAEGWNPGSDDAAACWAADPPFTTARMVRGTPPETGPTLQTIASMELV